jgi:FG-GAP-like repeat
MATNTTDFGPVYPLPFGVSFKVSAPAADPTNTDPINPGGTNFTYTIPDLSAYGVIGWGQGLPAASMNGPHLDPNALLTYNSSLSSGMTAVWSGATTIAGVGAGSYTGTVHTELVATIISGASGWSPDSWSNPSNDPAVVALIKSGTFAVNLQWLASPTGVPGSFEAMQTFFDDQHAAAGDLQTSSDGEFAGQQVAADLLFQNTSSGQASIWEMNGSTLVGGGPVSPNAGPAWKAIGTGDFNDDGQSDILWQNASGQASIWEMTGNTLIGGGAVNANPGPSWRAIGTGDFTDDGFSDGILFQNTSSGQVSIWEMSGNKLIGGGPVSPNPGPAWQAIGTGDFNKDGFSDILFQNKSTGQVSIWEMSGNKLIGGGPVNPNPGPAWQAIGTGDFNHDGFSDDILFQNKSTGQVSVWEMNGNALIGGGPVSPNPGTSWRAIGTGGDGGSDILFQNTSGQTSIWDMGGNTLTGGGPVSPNPGPSWRAVDLT